MGRLIFVPQYPAKMRYQEWWFTEFPKQLKHYFDEVIVLGERFMKNEGIQAVGSLFSPIGQSILFEQYQVNEYLGLELKNDDILFLADLSFPGFFTNILYHKRPKKCFAFYHAGALNAYDYFQPVRRSKYAVEVGQSKIFDKIFVGSQYHKNKVYKKMHNTLRLALPNPPLKTYPEIKKTEGIISVVRPTIQKVNKRLEKKVEKRFGKITRACDYNITSWDAYYKLIAEHKVMLITAKEETFGYCVIDAVLNGTVPIAPASFSYPELLTKDYLYHDTEDLMDKIEKQLTNPEPVQRVRCQDLMDLFYLHLASAMLEKQ